MKKFVVTGLAAAGLLASSTLAVAATAPIERAGAAIEDAEEAGGSSILIPLLIGVGVGAIVLLLEDNEDEDLPQSP